MALFSHGLKLKTSIRTLLEKEISNYTCLPCKPGSKLKIRFVSNDGNYSDLESNTIWKFKAYMESLCVLENLCH